MDTEPFDRLSFGVEFVDVAGATTGHQIAGGAVCGENFECLMIVQLALLFGCQRAAEEPERPFLRQIGYWRIESYRCLRNHNSLR